MSSRGIVSCLGSKSSKISLFREAVLQQSALGLNMSLAQAFIALTHICMMITALGTSRGVTLAFARLIADEQVTLMLEILLNT